MTVLVSVVKQMIADGRDIRAVACASTGDTSAALAAYAAAAGIPAIVILPRGKVSPAQLVQPLANGALVLALDTDFDGCMAIVQRLAAEGRRLPRQLDEQPAARRPEDAVARDRPAVRLGGARRRRHPGRQPRQRQRARRRLRHDAGARADRQAAAHRRRAGRGRQPALPGVPARTGPSSRSRRSRRWRRRSRSATRSRSARPSGPCSATTASSSRRRESELADAAARADRTGMFNCPHTGVALAALEKLVARGEIKQTDRVIVISTANGLKFTDFKVGVPHAHARGHHAAPCESAGRAAQRLRRRAARHR